MNVLLFARARDLAGKDTIVVGPPEPATIGELRRRLQTDCPALSGILSKSAFAVNDEFAGDAAAISAADEIALLPPVSGG